MDKQNECNFWMQLLIFALCAYIFVDFFILEPREVKQYNELKQQNIELTQKCEYYDSILTSMCTIGAIGDNE